MMSMLLLSHNVAINAMAEGPAGFVFPIGFIVLSIIVGPVVILTLASIFGKPRSFQIPGLFLVGFFLLVGALVASFAVFSIVLQYVVPQ